MDAQTAKRTQRRSRTKGDYDRLWCIYVCCYRNYIPKDNSLTLLMAYDAKSKKALCISVEAKISGFKNALQSYHRCDILWSAQTFCWASRCDFLIVWTTRLRENWLPEETILNKGEMVELAHTKYLHSGNEYNGKGWSDESFHKKGYDWQIYFGQFIYGDP